MSTMMSKTRRANASGDDAGNQRRHGTGF